MQVREHKFQEAERTLEGVLLADEFIRHYRRRDPYALRMAAILRHLEWEQTPEGRLQWEREIAEAERVRLLELKTLEEERLGRRSI
jgi:hypothetical protein